MFDIILAQINQQPLQAVSMYRIQIGKNTDYRLRPRITHYLRCCYEFRVTVILIRARKQQKWVMFSVRKRAIFRHRASKNEFLHDPFLNFSMFPTP
jgi:hypothetical protein